MRDMGRALPPGGRAFCAPALQSPARLPQNATAGPATETAALNQENTLCSGSGLRGAGSPAESDETKTRARKWRAGHQSNDLPSTGHISFQTNEIEPSSSDWDGTVLSLAFWPRTPSGRLLSLACG